MPNERDISSKQAPPANDDAHALGNAKPDALAEDTGGSVHEIDELTAMPDADASREPDAPTPSDPPTSATQPDVPYAPAPTPDVPASPSDDTASATHLVDAPSQEPGEPAPADTPASPAMDAPADDTQPSQPLPAKTLPLPEMAESPQAARSPKPVAGAAGEPRLRDVGMLFASWLGGRARAARGLLTRRRALTGLLALACLAVVAVALLMGLDAARMPPDDLVTGYVRTHLTAPSHASNAFTPNEPLELRTIEVVGSQRSKTRRDACDVDVVAVFANSAMETRVEERLTYVRSGDTWDCTASAGGSASHRATSGVDRELVLAQLDELLEAADTSPASGQHLGDLYRNATAEVVDEHFDPAEQTCTVSLRCSSEQGFVAYTCGLTASFRFASASGAWELGEVTASEGAYEPGLDPLVGTWYGSFARQQTGSARCLAASAEDLVLEITQVERTADGGATVAGTVTGVVHRHAPLTAEADHTDGDLVLDAAPFTGDLLDQTESTLAFACTVPDVTDAQVTLSLAFGLPDESEAAEATLTSTHAYQRTFLLFSWTEEVSFADSFTLERAA